MQRICIDSRSSVHWIPLHILPKYGRWFIRISWHYCIFMVRGLWRIKVIFMQLLVDGLCWIHQKWSKNRLTVHSKLSRYWRFCGQWFIFCQQDQYHKERLVRGRWIHLLSINHKRRTTNHKILKICTNSIIITKIAIPLNRNVIRLYGNTNVGNSLWFITRGL